MQFVSENPQSLITLIVILGAAGVALFCDLLKRNNEHLREINVELRVRNDAERRRNHILLQTIAAAPAAALAAPAAQAALPAPDTDFPRIAAEAQLDRGAEVASRRGIRRAKAEAAAPLAAEVPAGGNIEDARRLAREFLGHAASRSRNEGTGEEPTQSPSVRQPEVLVAASAAAQAPAQNGPSRKNWDKLLSKMKRQDPVEAETRPAHSRLGELIPFETIQATDLAVPEGFYEGMMLARILNSEKALRGLVMVISIDDRAASEAAVADHIRAILGSGEFACQLNDREFVIICPATHCDVAQERLSELAESFWQYQQAEFGPTAAVLCWGGVEAKGEAFANVLAAALGEMREARRGRRSLQLETPAQRRAV